MHPMFEALIKLLREPAGSDRRVKTDESILLIYPPEQELVFREQLLNTCFPALEAQGVEFHAVDLSGFLFEGMTDETIEALQEEEFDDYQWMVQGLSQRAETSLKRHLEALAGEHPGCSIVLYGTVAVFPLVRFGEVLRDLRDLDARVVVAFPGEEQGGRLHFMNQPDGGNYLAVKLFWR
jgi:hypothetical protein